jgi:HD-like signal output (HDOD) protein
MTPDPSSSPRPRKRILLVDDEAAILDLFSMMFRKAASDWDIAFSRSGAEALTLMEEQSFDVVVSDMRMPGMSGAQFLSEVMQRHPNTARLILSGYSEQEAVAKCIGAAHQFLMKPCNLATLQTTLQRVCALDVFLRNDNLKSLLAKMAVVPSLPSVYYRMLKESQSPSASAESIGGIVALDPGLTAQLLQLVNSAFFGFSRQVCHPAEAVQWLGISTVRSLAVCIHAFSCFDPSKAAFLSCGEMWNHSLHTGLNAQKIAQSARVGQALIEEAFIAGLLHDLGKLMLCANLPEPYQQAQALAREKSIPVRDAERDVFGATHADIGAYLLGLWGLPVPIVEAVALHHQPLKSTSRTFAPLTAVHVADTLDLENTDETNGGIASGLDLEYLKQVAVLDQVETWRTQFSAPKKAAA